MKKISMLLSAVLLASTAFAAEGSIDGTGPSPLDVLDLEGMAARGERVLKVRGGYAVYPEGTNINELSRQYASTSRISPNGESFNNNNWNSMVVMAKNFSPQDDSRTFWAGGSTNWTYRTFGSNAVMIHNFDLPHGSVIRGINAAVIDSSDTGNVQFYLYKVNRTTDALTTLVSYSSTGTAASPVTERFNYVPLAATERADTYNYTYMMTIWLPTIGPTNQALHGMIWFGREMASAPATANFTDVPTTHLFFREIEAMRTSGVTLGCTATTFCPNDTLTRAQMAVFLSRALGLNVPSNIAPAP